MTTSMSGSLAEGAGVARAPVGEGSGIAAEQHPDGVGPKPGGVGAHQGERAPARRFLDLHGRTSKALRALTEAEMRRHGLHYGQDLVLAVLWERDGRPPGEVAAALHVTTPTIVKMATRMTAAGLLTRRRDERDNRLVRLWLTERGLP